MLLALLRNGFLLLFFSTSFAYAEPRDFLCGPDEDGCPSDGYEYCLCIPVDEENAKTPFCLDFDKMDCLPLKNAPHCQASLIYPDQGACLATLLQSESEPACPIVPHHFCEEHGVKIMAIGQ